MSRSIRSTPSFARALVERVQGRVVAVVADPDRGLDEHLGPVQAGAADALPHLALVGIRGRGVDVAIARAKSGLDRVDGLDGWRLGDRTPGGTVATGRNSGRLAPGA
jgi:hypothetical protein